MSAVFVESPCQFTGDTIVNSLAWSNTDQIAAMSTNTADENDREINQVMFLNNEGSLLSDAVVNHSCPATTFDWQPSGKVLAIGYADGMVSCWLVDGKNKPTSTYSNATQHSCPITTLKWNPMGKRLITGDKKGQVCVWTVDARGTLFPSRQYRKKGEITNLAFCLIAPKVDLARKPEVKQAYSPAFFFGTDKGLVAYADDLGHCTDVQQLSSSIDVMLFFEERSRLVIITRSLLLTQYQVGEDGKVSRVMQMKLSVAGDIGDKGLRSVVWAGPGLIAAASQEKMVRLLDIATDETYNLSLSALGESVDRSDRVGSVSFSPLDRYLAVGTQAGLVAVWKYNGPIRDVSGARGAVPSTSAAQWELQFKTNLRSPVIQLSWHGGQGTLAVVTDEKVYVLSESIMKHGMCGDLAIVQTSITEVAVHIGGQADVWIEDTSVVVRGITVSRTCFAVWSGKFARVYRVDAQVRSIEPLEPFQTMGIAMAVADASHIVDEALFIADQSQVKIVNFTGVQKGAISFTEAEGNPIHLNINGKYLGVVTSKGVIKILDIQTPTKPKLLGSAGKFVDSSTGMGIGQSNAATPLPAAAGKKPSASPGGVDPTAPVAATNSCMAVREVKVNCDGTRLAILTDYVEGALQIRHADTRLHVYDRNKGGVNVFDFAKNKRSPISIQWDDEDDRILVCEALRHRIVQADPMVSKKRSGEDAVPGLPSTSTAAAPDIDGDAEVEVVVLFATSEHGLLLQDSFSREAFQGSCIGVTVPRIYFRPAAVNSDGDAAARPSRREGKVVSKVMRDFVGMSNADTDANVKHAIIDFSFFLTLGKLDEAYRCIKAIDSPTVWENMAQMCIKTKRLDVAEVCLGNMGNARGAAALREARQEGNADVSVGILAIQLGFNDEAAKLFREAGRYDMLNQLYQSAGLWEKAIRVAAQFDRVHLKTTHYSFAKYLESIGDISGAIENYELSGTAKTEVPRMLYHLGRMDELEDFVQRSEDSSLLKWWGAYLESNERFEKACKYYRKAGDFLSLEDFQQAGDIVHNCGDRAAAYHFARQLESQGEYQAAIDSFADAGCFNHCIRLARAYGLDSELMRFGLKSTPSLMLDCATYFEEKGELDKAVQLYHKGGDLPKALDLCFRAGDGSAARSTGVFDMLNAIAADLGADSSPQTLARCAEFLMQHKQFDKAVELYVMAKRYPQAIEMCLQHKVTITEEMVKMLTPPEAMDAGEKKEVLKNLARALKKQGSFTLASKLFTQAGDRVRAMKCLVKSGDTKAVIQFASISRNTETYTLAANYLQQMNWRESVEVMKAIINFYSKAKAFEQLAAFYDSCAQVEIDEYRDYEKAIGALREALKYLARSGTRQAAEMVDTIEKRIALIEKFVQARRMMKSDPNRMVSICENLLQERMLEEAIRAGDCLAMLVEHFHDLGQMNEAYNYIKEMEDRKIALHPYIDAEVLANVMKSVGKSVPTQGAGYYNPQYESKHDDDDDEVVEEEDIVEEEEVEEDSRGKQQHRGRK